MRLVRIVPILAAVVLTLGCPMPPNPDGGTGGGRGGGTGGGGGGLTPFGVSFLDENARDAVYHAMAIDPVAERIGVVYLTPAGTEMNMGHPDYFIKYVEWRQGAIVVPPETIRTVQRFVGLSIAFDPISGDPFVGYLGGDPGFIPGMSIFWFQSDAALARRSGGTWTETLIATDGNQVICNSVVSDRGFLVGLWPAIAFDSTGRMYYGYRDGHGGQFPQQDWAGSDVEIWEGNVPPTTGKCAAQGGNNKDAYGGHLRMIIAADDQPAIIHDQMFGTADTNGINTIFQRRLTNGNWTPPGGSLIANPNTQSGSSLAWDPMEGFGIAFIERTSSRLGYLSSADGVTFNAVDPVFGSGSGGWYPSLAMDPINHEPAIAFYVCSNRSSVNEQSCSTTDDELRVTQRIAGMWRETVVDTEGGHTPQLGFFASGKRVIVYRMPPSVDPGTGLTVTTVGALKIAVER